MRHVSLPSFPAHLKALGRRPGTIDSYCGIVERFLRSVSCPPEETTSEHVYAFLVARCAASGISSSWYNVNYHAMVLWLKMRGLDADLRGLAPQRIHRQPPRWLTEDELRQLLAATEQRHFRLFFQLMAATGLRISEGLALRVSDMTKSPALLRVRCGKGGDGRLVPIPPTLLLRLRDYWRTFRPTGVLFQRKPGIDDRPMLASTVNAALHRAAERAGFTEQISSHRLRHSFAFHSLQRGMHIVALKEVMGHRCLESTIRYVTPDMARDGRMIDLLADLGVAE